MRGLKWAIGVMSVLIIAGIAVIGVTIIRRVGGATPPSVTQLLNEPAGTHITGVAAAADGLALLLQGGGPDRVVIVDPRTGRSAPLVALRP